MLADTVDSIDDLDAPEEIAKNENEDDLGDDEDVAADDIQALVRISRGSRVYTARVGIRPVPRVISLNDALVIEFDMDKPKRASSTSWELYELYKYAKTVGEARQKGASTGHVGYDIRKDFACLVVDPAVVVFEAAAAPIV